MRVEVQIPGGVVSYLVDLKGDRYIYIYFIIYLLIIIY